MCLGNRKMFVAIILSALLLAACDERGSNGKPAGKLKTDTAQSAESSTVANNPAGAESTVSANHPRDEAPSIKGKAGIVPGTASTAENVPGADEKEAKTALAAGALSTGDKTAGTASNRPYRIVDGHISANVIEGWKTYNGGGCGTCHGKGAIGAVGPKLGDSVTQKLSKDEFINTVTNGRPGTLMRPNKTNKRIIANINNLYAYLVARGDGVLGPENLIKYPFGKKPE